MSAAEVRRLGFSEARMHCMQSLLHGSTQSTAAVRLHGPLAVDELVRGLRRLRARYAILQTVIEEREGALWFVAAPPGDDVPLEVATRADDAEWLPALERVCNTPLDARRALWRVLLLTPPAGGAAVFDLIVVCHHALVDGHGMQRLLDELLSATTATDADARPSLPVPPPAEAMMPGTVPWEDYARLQAAMAAAQPTLQLFAHRRSAPVVERRTRTLVFDLSADEAAALSARAAASGTSLNSLASAALLRSVAAHGEGRSAFALYTAFSLRRLCDERLSEDDLGCYLAVTPTFHEVTPTRPLAELAAEHAQRLSLAVLQSARHPRDVALPAVQAATRRLAELTSFVQDIGYTYAEDELRDRYGGLALGHVYMTANRAAGTAALVVHALGRRGVIHFTVNYTEPLQEAAWVRRVMADFRAQLTSRVD